MDSRHVKIRMSVEGDRLSNLPDDLIHKILSFISIKHAIKTSALSSRWRYIWTSMPSLNVSVSDFPKLPDFSEFVTRVLSGRNNQIELSTAKLTCCETLSHEILERFLSYAFSHNVQQLDITSFRTDKSEFPFYLFMSQSLKHLTLKGYFNNPSITNPPTWELPALATLNLQSVTLYDDEDAGIFSNCANLKNLTLNKCILKGLNGFNLFHPGVTSLTLEGRCNDVNVVTPQLNSLTIINCRRTHLICAPNLSSLHYKDNDYYYVHQRRSYFGDEDGDGKFDDDSLEISTQLLHLEKVDICIYYDSIKGSTHKIVRLLQQLHSVKFLTLNLELVKRLSSSAELISHQPSPFVNLKSLKIYPVYVPYEKQTREVTLSTEVKNYLLDSSLGATLTIVSYEEIRAVMNVTLARNLMIQLQVLLDQWKVNSETNTGHLKQDKAPMESHMPTVHEQGEVIENHRAQLETKMKWDLGEGMTRIESYWKDLREQLEKGSTYTGRTISLLREIDEVLKKVPGTHMAKLQQRFYGLYARARTIMDNSMDCMKIQCDKKPSRSDVFFHELATLSQRSP